LIDNVLSQGTKSGYVFTAVGAGGPPATTYSSRATPVTPGQTGQRNFCSDQSGVIFYTQNPAACTNASTPL